MIRTIIIDDEQHCIDRLVNLLTAEHSAEVSVVGTAATVAEGTRLVSLLHPALIFLDVQVQDQLGFEVLKAMPSKDTEVIFTTGYEQFALQAIKFSAIDYLLKPVDKDDLHIALSKLSDQLSKKMTVAKLETLLSNIEKKNSRPGKILVPTINGFELLDVEEIIRCESDINYTTLFLKDKKKLLVARTLKEFESLLQDHNFFRVHNSHLVNLQFIKSYHKGKGGVVYLSDGSQVEVSSRRKDDFLRKMAQL